MKESPFKILVVSSLDLKFNQKFSKYKGIFKKHFELQEHVARHRYLNATKFIGHLVTTQTSFLSNLPVVVVLYFIDLHTLVQSVTLCTVRLVFLTHFIINVVSEFSDFSYKFMITYGCLPFEVF